ncbi:MarR family winged helix-turn-helix transcriptional regulator [Eikenella exigua]|uniref:MarR family winged helix-turn-helix transcriptional regulator n=1 Tax=Eikenella exigua TaxID=2528037 RepID=UPI00129B2D8D|nr:MarR family transcriptional regulator [Eikenella exigua]
MTQAESKEVIDVVGYITDHWKKFDHRLDTSGTEIIGRIIRIGSIISQLVDENLANYKLTVGEFDVLAALLREPNQTLTPKQIQDLVLISSGGLTNRINKLEKKGLVQRILNPEDRRSWLINLLPKCETLIKKVVPSHLSIETKAIKNLSFQEYQQLRDLLITLSKDLEKNK